MSANSNHPAFPFPPPSSNTGPEESYHGLSKRELFAVMAMQGLLSDPEVKGTAQKIAAGSVGYADALLAELAKEKTT